MAKLRARLDTIADQRLQQLADEIDRYLDKPAPDPANLEALSRKLRDLSKRRDAQRPVSKANDNDDALDADLAQLDAQLRDAMRTLRQLPSGRVMAASSAGGWPSVLREWSGYGAAPAESPRLIPSTRDIALMERMLNAVLAIPDGTIRKVLMLHASGRSFRKLAKELHYGHERVRRMYRQGLQSLAEVFSQAPGQTRQN
jgi:hypothetical protein